MGQVYLALLGSAALQPTKLREAKESVSKADATIREVFSFDFIFLHWLMSKDWNHESRANHLVKRSRKVTRAR